MNTATTTATVSRAEAGLAAPTARQVSGPRSARLLHTATFYVPLLVVVLAWTKARMPQRQEREEGSLIELVIISGAIAVAAIAIVAIIVGKVTAKTGQLDLG